MALAETAHLVTQLDLKDGLSSGLARARSNVTAFGRGVDADMKRIGRGVGQVGHGLARVGLIAGGAVVAGLGGAAKAAIDFEDAFAGVRKTVDETDLKKAGLSFEGLARDFRDMATEIPISAVEFARLGETAGALGIRAKDIVEFSRVTALMGVTTNLSADEAADAFGRLGTILHLRGKDYTELADAIVALGNAGASTEAEITEISKRFAAEGKAAGLSTLQIAGLASATASLGFAPERGGTALARVFANMGTNISLANDKGKEFSKLLGEPISKLQREIDQGRGLKIFMDVLKEIRGLSPTAANRVLASLGVTNQSDRTIFRAMSDQLPFINDQLEIARNSTGAMSAEAEKRFDTVKSKFALLKNIVIEAGITVGEGFAPALGRAATRLSDWIKRNRDDLVEIGRDIGKAIDGIDWGKVMGGIKTIVGLLKDAWGIIRQIPPELLALGAGAIGLNKLSGGLLGAGVGNIVGGLAGAVTKGVAAKIPGVGQFVATPVYVTNWPAGGLGGGVAGAAGGMGLLGKVALAGMVVGTVAGIYEAVDTQILQPVAQHQNELMAQAMGIIGEGRDKAATDIENMTRLLRDAQGPERVTIDTAASREIGMGLKNAADEIVKGSTFFTRGQDLQRLVDAQKQAQAHGWTDVAEHIGRDIERLRRKTPTAGEIGEQVAKHTDEKDGSARNDRRLGRALSHVSQVDTHKGNREFGGIMERAGRLITRALGTDGEKSRRATRQAIDVLRRAQVRAFETGHTKLARNIGRDIDTMRRTLGRKSDTIANATDKLADKIPTEVNVTTNVSISVRDQERGINTTRRYGVQAV